MTRLIPARIDNWLEWSRAKRVLLPPGRWRLPAAVVLAVGCPAAVEEIVVHRHRGLAALTLIAVVLVCSVIGRMAGGVLAGITGALAYLYWFAPPDNSFGLVQTSDAFAVAIFVGIALLVALITGVQQAARAEVAQRANWFEAAATSLQELFDGVDAIVWKGDPNFQAQFISKSAERILGYPCARWTSEPDFWLEHLHPEDRERALAEARERVALGADYQHEYRMVAADGRVVWIRAIVRVSRDALRRPEALHGIAIDVSETRRLEEQLRHSQKMDAIGQLAGGIAHAFNNLLTVITGYTGIARSSLAATDVDLDFEFSEIEAAARRAAALTQQLLAFSRRQVLRPTVIELNEVIVELDRLLRHAVGSHIVLRCITAPFRVTVLADRMQIEQLVVNLALNAREAMPDGGELCIEIGEVQVDEAAAAESEIEPGAYAQLTVSDTGRGMDAYTRAHAFEPFFTTKPQGTGTGLGLSTSYGIVRQSGGAVLLDTAPGEGTTVTVLLRRTDERAPLAAQPASAPAIRGCESVLLVEDEDVVRKVVTGMLEAEGYRVLAVGDAFHAEEVFADDPCDVLVTDVVMPGRNGAELAGRLLARQPGLRVLFVSGYTSDAFPVATEFPLGSSFLQKPFTRAALARELRTLLDAPAARDQHR